MRLSSTLVLFVMAYFYTTATVLSSVTPTESVTSPGAFCTEADFSPWSSWTACSVTCGEGSQSRTRSCNGAITSGIRSCKQQPCDNVGALLSEFQCSTGIEISFLIDASGSVGEENFRKVQQFTKDVTTQLKNGYERLNLTIITFNNEAKISVSVNESQSLEEILKAEQTLVYTHGGTETHKALQLLYQSIIRNNSTSPKVAVVITDGASFQPDLTKAAAKLLKDSGVILIVLGVGDDLNPYELSAVSSDPDERYLFRLDNFNELSSLIGLFSHQSCAETSTVPSASTTTVTPTTVHPTTTVTELPKTTRTKLPRTTATSLPTTTITQAPNETPKMSSVGTDAPQPISALTPTARPVVVSTKVPTARPGLVTNKTVETFSPPTNTPAQKSSSSAEPATAVTANTFKPTETKSTSPAQTQLLTEITTTKPSTTNRETYTTETTTRTSIETSSTKTTSSVQRTSTARNQKTNNTAFTTITKPKQPSTKTAKESTTTTTTETPTETPSVTTATKAGAVTTLTEKTTAATKSSITTESSSTETPTKRTTASSVVTNRTTESTLQYTTTVTFPPSTETLTTTKIPTSETTKPTTENRSKTTAINHFTFRTTVTDLPKTEQTTLTETVSTSANEPTSQLTKYKMTDKITTPREQLTTTITKLPGSTSLPTTTESSSPPNRVLSTQSTSISTSSAGPSSLSTLKGYSITSLSPLTSELPVSSKEETTVTYLPYETTTTSLTTEMLTAELKTSEVSTSKSTEKQSSLTPIDTTTMTITETSSLHLVTSSIPETPTTVTEQITTSSTLPNIITNQVNVTFPETTITEPSTTVTEDLTSEQVTTTTEPPTTTTASCIAKVADIVFVVDTSGSIGRPNFERIKEFIKSVVLTFDVDSRYTRVGLIEFSTTPRIEFKLNEKTNITDLLEAISNITYSGGGTSTSDALELMRVEGFDRERPLAPDIAVVITDGLSKFPPLTKVQAQLARADGIEMFSIGIGNQTSSAELLAIASSPRYVFEVGDYQTLFTLDSVVAHRACGVILPEEYHTRSSTPSTTTRKGCYDIDPQCPSYPRDSCSDFEPWARKNCPRKCGFCPGFPLVEPPCEDTIGNCVQYGTDMCSSTSQYEWVDSHCRKFCGFCGNKTDSLTTSTTEPTSAMTASTVSSCSDLEPNCANFEGGKAMCTKYGSWARSHCAKFCGYCFTYETVTSITVNNIRCPAWKLPDMCTLERADGHCCPMPKCPADIILTVKRN